MSEKTYRCLNPVGIQDTVKQYPLAPRLDTIDGKTIFFSIGAGEEVSLWGGSRTPAVDAAFSIDNWR